MKATKRDYKTPAGQSSYDIEPDFFERDYMQQEARWKRKNRVKWFKHKIATLYKQLEECDSSRIIARRQIGDLRDFFLRTSRLQTDKKVQAHLLEKVGECNLILGVTMNDDELHRDFKGENVQPYKLKLTDEERKILHEQINAEPESEKQNDNGTDN